MFWELLALLPSLISFRGCLVTVYDVIRRDCAFVMASALKFRGLAFGVQEHWTGGVFAHGNRAM